MTRRLAVVHLGRAGAWGNRNRVATWQRLGAAVGAQVDTVDLATLRSRPGDLARVPRVLRGAVVPEALSWSGRALADRLEPGATVVLVTARAVDLALVPPGCHVVLDLVDRLSESYRLRAALAGPAGRLLYAGLEVPMRRFERRRRPGVRLVAAGRGDAAELGAGWLPNLLPDPLPDPPARAPVTDLLFHGSLGYPPNVEAVRLLAAVWPALRALRPQTTLTVAGASPSAALARTVAQTPGWTLHRDFPDLDALLASARVAVAPLLSATGLQNKVLESAAAGLPTVVTPAVARGLDEAFPVVVAGPDDLARTLAGLLDDPDRRRALGLAGREHVGRHYTVGAWRDRAEELLDPASAVSGTGAAS